MSTNECFYSYNMASHYNGHRYSRNNDVPTPRICRGLLEKKWKSNGHLCSDETTKICQSWKG